MPIALLLQETVYTFRWGARHLEPWVHLVQTEETLIDRARGAFLTHWFGHLLPLEGAFVRVAIDNLRELRARYFAVAGAVAPEPSGPNLTEPLAGLTGEITGILLSPTGSLLLLAFILHNFPYWLRVLANALGWKVVLLPLLPALGPAVGTLLPVAFFGALALAIKNPPEARGLYDLLGAAAQALIAAADFIKLLLGPREAIRNPLLARILTIFDLLAGLFPYLLAFVAVVVTRIGPLIEGLAAQVRPFLDLVDEVEATVSFILNDIWTTILRYWPLVLDKADFVLVQLELLPEALDIGFSEFFANMREAIETLATRVAENIIQWLVHAAFAVARIVVKLPLTKLIQSAALSFGVASRVLASPASTSPPTPSSIPKPHITAPGAFLAAMGAPPPGLAAIGKLANIDIKYQGALFEDYLPLSPAPLAAVKRARQPRSVFAEEQAAFAHEPGKPPAAAIALRVDQLRLRDLISVVVGRILPPELRVHMDDLLKTFLAIDQNLYGLKLERQEFPVRDLPDSGTLRPVVRRLVLRAYGQGKSAVDAFQTNLQLAMTRQLYPAPVEV